MKKYEGQKLEVISFRRNDSEIGMHLNLKSELSPILIQDVFVCTSYKDCVEYHYCEPKDLIIEILEVNNHDQISKCIIAGNKRQIESFLIASGEATPNNPIDFKTVNFPEELATAMSRVNFSIDEIIEKIKEANLITE